MLPTVTVGVLASSIPLPNNALKNSECVDRMPESGKQLWTRVVRRTWILKGEASGSPMSLTVVYLQLLVSNLGLGPTEAGEKRNPRIPQNTF